MEGVDDLAVGVDVAVTGVDSGAVPLNFARVLGAAGFLAAETLLGYAASDGLEIAGELSGFGALWALVWLATRLALGMWIGEALWRRGR